MKVICSKCGKKILLEESYFDDGKIFCVSCRLWQNWFTDEELNEFMKMEID